MKVKEQEESKKPKRPKMKASSFGIRTKLARSVGQSARYDLDAVRALPSADSKEVVLQATDGHQAVCLVAPGRMARTHLVPPQVMPNKRLSDEAVIKLVDGQWQSSEGKTAEDSHGKNKINFPSLADAMPMVHKRPFYETQALADRRSQNNCKAESVHVVLGIDVDLLRKVAESIGDSRLTLFVPVPVKGPNNPDTAIGPSRPSPNRDTSRWAQLPPRFTTPQSRSRKLMFIKVL